MQSISFSISPAGIPSYQSRTIGLIRFRAIPISPLLLCLSAISPTVPEKLTNRKSKPLFLRRSCIILKPQLKMPPMSIKCSWELLKLLQTIKFKEELWITRMAEKDFVSCKPQKKMIKEDIAIAE